MEELTPSDMEIVPRGSNSLLANLLNGPFRDSVQCNGHCILWGEKVVFVPGQLTLLIQVGPNKHSVSLS